MIYTHVAALLLGMAVAGTGAWKTQNWRYAAKEKTRVEAEREDRLRKERGVQTAATSHEKTKERIRVQFRTITQEVERVIQADPVVRHVCLPDDGVRLINTAINGTNAAGEPRSPMPASGRTR